MFYIKQYIFSVLHSFHLQRIAEVTSDSTLDLVVDGTPSVLYLANKAITGYCVLTVVFVLLSYFLSYFVLKAVCINL